MPQIRALIKHKDMKVEKLIPLQTFKPVFGKTENKKNIPRDALLSVGILIICSLIGLIFHVFGFSEANIMSIYILGILLISSITSEMIFGVFASIAGMLLFNCLYAEPMFTLFVYDAQYSITAIIMLIASIIIGYAMSLLRHYLEMEKLATRRSDVLLETSRTLQQAQNIDEIFSAAATQLQALVNQTIALFPMKDGKLLDPIIKNHYEVSAPAFDSYLINEEVLRTLASTGKTAENPAVINTNNKKGVYYKVKTNETVFAIAGIISDSRWHITEFESNLICAMLDEAALAIDKRRLQEFNERIAREAEMERLRANLLRTISHDLRTPLTSISGNADMLLHNEGQIELDSRKRLYQDIYNDAEWLASLVENLLSITRIENGTLSIKTEPELLQEVIYEALDRLGNRLKNHDVAVEMSDELIIVKVDARLVIQVLINIVDNAVKYTQPGSRIIINAFRSGENAVVEIADNGGGISVQDKEKIFDMFYTANNEAGDGRRGIGLGLSLCRAIIQAHGGTIYIRDNIPSGTIIGLTLKSEEVHLERDSIGD